MNEKKHISLPSILKFMPILACILLAAFLSGREVSVQTILAYTPENPWYATLIILLFYGLKSMSFVFPIAVLQITTGHLFPLASALLINLLGRIITITIPYWIGRISGAGLASQLEKKYPRLGEITAEQKRNPRFISFLLRTFCFLPGDAVSLYLGAIKIPFLCYLEGGVLGTALGVTLSTIFGSSITEPESPAFWISAFLMVLTAVVSFLFYRKKRSQK